MRKKLIIALVTVVLVLSLGFNAYHYGYKWAFTKGFQAGVNSVSNAVVAQYRDTGKVQMRIDEKDIVLVAEKGRRIGNVDDMIQ